MQTAEAKPDAGEVSDGYHTFNELYAHRCALFLALMLSQPELSWRSRRHSDGSAFDGWWIGGMNLHTGQITYHLPDDLWEALDGVDGLVTLPQAPKWDGHTAADVVSRLMQWVQDPF